MEPSGVAPSADVGSLLLLLLVTGGGVVVVSVAPRLARYWNAVGGPGPLRLLTAYLVSGAVQSTVFHEVFGSHPHNPLGEFPMYLVLTPILPFIAPIALVEELRAGSEASPVWVQHAVGLGIFAVTFALVLRLTAMTWRLRGRACLRGCPAQPRERRP
jgi:hypothetical protein